MRSMRKKKRLTLQDLFERKYRLQYADSQYEKPSAHTDEPETSRGCGRAGNVHRLRVLTD